jgi:hypothetical protein
MHGEIKTNLIGHIGKAEGVGYRRETTRPSHPSWSSLPPLLAAVRPPLILSLVSYHSLFYCLNKRLVLYGAKRSEN